LKVLHGTDAMEVVFEPVCLLLTENTVRAIYTSLRLHHDDGDLAGCMVTLKRGDKGSSRVAVLNVVRHRLSSNRPIIDVVGVVLARLRIASDFFGKKFDVVEETRENAIAILAAKERATKPRIPLGKKR